MSCYLVIYFDHLIKNTKYCNNTFQCEFNGMKKYIYIVKIYFYKQFKYS